MTNRFNNTGYIRRFVSRFPVFNYLLLQIVLWIIGYVFLAVLSHLVLLTVGTALHANVSLRTNLFVALFFGFFVGITSGYTGLLLEKKWSNKTLGIIIITRAFINLVIFYSFDQYSQVRYLSLPAGKIF